jgi:hypothetical protein
MAAWPRLLPVLLALLGAGARPPLRRYGVLILLAALAGLLGVMGLAMLVGSVFLRLADGMSAAAAAAVTGGGLLVIAGLILLAGWLVRRRPRRRPIPAPRAGNAAVIAELAAVAQAAIQRDARSEHPRFALAALVVGCAIGASPKLRAALAALLGRAL